MFKENGSPTGYDQIAPGRDAPQNRPGAPNGRPPTGGPDPLQSAIVGPSQYPPDPGFVKWRQGPVQPPTMTPGASGPGAIGLDKGGGYQPPQQTPPWQEMPPQAGQMHTMQQPQNTMGQGQQAQPGMGANATGQIAPPQGQPNVQDFIKQYQAAHPVSEGLGPISAAMKQAGYNVSPYMYGNTASNNEVNLNGEKYKLLGGEGTPGAYWYQAGMNDGGGGMAGMRPWMSAHSGMQQQAPQANLQGAINPNTTDMTSLIQTLLQQQGGPRF